MINSELISFFKQVNTITRFERRRKIYDLTNNLDIDLLFDLKIEYHGFYMAKLVKAHEKIRKTGNGMTSEKDVIGIGNNFNLNKDFDDFLENNEYSTINDVIDETAQFMDDINELIKRKIKSTSKTPRIKSDIIYKSFMQNEFLDEDYERTEDSNDEDFSFGGIEAERKESEEIINFSNTSISGKIIFLEKLGIIDFLRKEKPFNTSVNMMASVLGAITGAKPTTIQSMLNPMLNKGVDSKNNPLNSPNSVSVIENKLNQIGFNFKKTKK